MSLIVPNTQEVEVADSILNQALTLRLYSNNVTPTGGTTVAAFTEVSGGGYAAIALVGATWSIVSGDPTAASYGATTKWTFTGATDAPGSVYGYYVTRDSDGALMWAERFPAANVPFVPQNGSIIQLLLVYNVTSQF